MDGDQFTPSGFGVAGSAALAIGLGCALVQTGNNVANMMAEHRDATDAETINDSFRAVLESHDEMVEIVRRRNATIDAMQATLEQLSALCEAQAAELARR